MFDHVFIEIGATWHYYAALFMKFSLKILLFAFIFSLLSCQGKEEPVTRENLLAKGFALMDQGSYDEAIKYFAEVAARDPHYHVKMAWASAYAGRAGVKLQQLYSFIVVKKSDPLDLHFLGGAADKQTSEFMNELSQYVDHWTRIPFVESEKRKDLSAAVEILNGVDQSGARLYSAALRLVIIKSSVTEAVKNWQVLFKSQKKICSADLYPYFQWALRILDELVFLSEDLQVAFPDRKQDYEDISHRLGQIKKDAELIPWPQENQCIY